MTLPEPQLSKDQLQEILASSFGEGVPIVDAITDDGVIVRYQVNERNSRPGGKKERANYAESQSVDAVYCQM